MQLKNIRLILALVTLIGALSVAGASAARPTRECTFNPYLPAANTCPPSSEHKATKNHKQAARKRASTQVRIHCVNPYMQMAGRCS